MRRDDDVGSDDTLAPTSPTTPAPVATGVSAPEPFGATLADTTLRPGPTDARSAAPPVELPTITTDHYQIDRVLARGGMGRILVARDRRLGRTVALKELVVQDESLAARFAREVRITARLQHPAIIAIHEAGRWPSGAPFYAMKLVTGRPLDEVIAAATTLAARLALLPNVIAVVDALAYAHSEGVIHRDIKPNNVLVGAFGETVVIDWGLAKDLKTDEPAPADPLRAPVRRSDETVVGSVLGTPAYMPPEQAAGAPLDARADVYALGALLYHVLAGEPPYTGATADAVLDAVEAGPPRPLAERVPDVPPDLLAIVERAMARDADDRFATAAEMADELKRFQTGQLVASHDYTAWELVRRWLRRNRGIALTAAAAVVVALVGAGVFLVRERSLRDDAVKASQRAERERQNAQLEQRKAERALALNLVDSGRLDLQEGRPERAVARLAEAYKTLFDDPSTQFLLARALSWVEPMQRVFVHGTTAWSGALSADGAVLVTTGSDKIPRVWNVATGQLVASVTGHMAALSPDGTRLATTASYEGPAQVWDPRTGRQLASLLGHTGQIKTISFSPDGARVVSGSTDQTARVWDAATGGVVAVLRGHSGSVVSALFDATGTRVVTASDDGTARLWDARTGALVRTFSGHDGEVLAAFYDAAHARVVTASADHTARVWDARTGAAIATVRHDDLLTDLELSPDGTRLVTASVDRTARVWDVATGRLLSTLANHTDIVQAARFSPDGARIVTASSDRTVRVWDARGWELAHLAGHRDKVLRVAFTPDGMSVMSASADGTARLWDVRATLEPRGLAGHTHWVYEVDVSSDDTRFVTCSMDRTIRVWDARTGAMQRTIGPVPITINDCSFTPDGARIVAAGDDHTITVWDVATGERRDELRGHTDRVLAARLSPDSTRLVSASADRTAMIWDPATGATLRTLNHPSWVVAAAWSPDGNTLAASTMNDGVMVWDARTGSLTRTLTGHSSVVWALAFSPDGTRIVTTGADRMARLWEAHTGRLLGVLEGHTMPIRGVAWSADGALIATGSDDRTVRIWDPHTLVPLAILRGHTDEVLALAFTRDRARLLTASRDGTVRIWPVAPELRPPAAIAKLAELVPWKLDNGLLVAR